MLKKVLLVSVMVLALLFTVALASDNAQVCEKITYFDAQGNILTSYTEGAVTAVAEVNNTTSKTINPVLVVCSYTEGRLDNFWYDTAEEAIACGEEGAVMVEFTPSEGAVIKATLIDSLKTLKPYLMEAQMLNNTTDLVGIFVNGVALADYDDAVDEYTLQWDGEGDITALVTDGGSKVSVTEPEALPGYADIKVTSAFGDERDISVILYENPEDLYSLKGLKYEINGVEYTYEEFSHKNFDSAKGGYTYSLSLPKNTFFTTLIPEPAFEGATVTVEVQDINFQGKTFNGVYYRHLGFHYLFKTVFEKNRKAIDNVIPIRSEESIATVTVTYGENSRKYIFSLTAQQPRLTSFNVNPDAATSTTPLFMGGAALYNDNGTTFSADRWWALTNISENLVGASMFLMPVSDNKADTTWYSTHTDGVYFAFTADTPGTIYMTKGFSAALNPEYENAGWVHIDQSHITGYKTSSEMMGLSTTFNDFGDDRFQVSLKEFSDNVESRYGPNSYTVSGGSVFTDFYKKTFAAGEVVEIFNSGSAHRTEKSTLGYFIVWDIEE